ncbi:MAG: GntR family transcriptional regulator [Peptoniphilus sp.]|uniref:GntR family transcriptional regulator n=1 Tax=Peptoniphilus sp. TaxID=1971214 RepID=UPI002A7525DB|nr:GntR family transcriptional regulator [Peptoniphilus sp.]MDY2987515.1 GntR family transcriptional regulator [Peptoniphilus sp.]
MLNIKSFSDAAYDEIKERILNGFYTPGMSLNERTLSEDFGVSRTPIRAALQKLSIEGWIINEPYKKNVVKQFNLNEILEAQKVRTALELIAIVDASKNITDEDILYLETLVDEQEYTKDYSKSFSIDRIFHTFIYEKSGNTILLSVLNNISDIVRYFGLMAMYLPGRDSQTITEHRKIVSALKTKNLDKINEAMEYHMSQTTSALLQRLNIKENLTKKDSVRE